MPVGWSRSMASTRRRRILPSVVRLLLLLDLSSVQSASIDRTPENAGLTTAAMEGTSQRPESEDDLAHVLEDFLRQIENRISSSTASTPIPEIEDLDDESEDSTLSVAPSIQERSVQGHMTRSALRKRWRTDSKMKMKVISKPYLEVETDFWQVTSMTRLTHYNVMEPIKCHLWFPSIWGGRSVYEYHKIECIEYRKIDMKGARKPGCSRTLRFQPGGYRLIISGGRNPKRRTFSHIVALGRENEDEEFVLHCGGTLISSSWVLTAAHCTHGVSGGITTALLGMRRLNDAKSVRILVNRTIRHPSYKPPALYADIALVELSQPVTFSDKIKPACLQQPSDVTSGFVWVSGWGAKEFGGAESNELQEARLKIMHNEVCGLRHNRSVPAPNGIQSTMICAGSPYNNWEQDTCQGDSGGPMQIVHRPWPCLRQIIGITSFGSGCAFVDSPGVYTRISHYLDWIEDIVWPEDN